MNEDIPSKRIELLQQMRSMHVINLIRYSWDPIEYVIENLRVPKSDVFRFTLGPLVIVLENGLEVGFNSIPEYASVVVWLEDSSDIPKERDSRLSGDSEFYPIEVTDEVHGDLKISSVIGISIESISILKKDPRNAILATRPREVGVIIKFSSGIDLVASHGLHNESDDFSVILREDIDQNVLPTLTFMEI